MSAPIAETERGHRRGVVLGFTMAELLLLLLFCLLLVSATAMMEKDKQIVALSQRANVPVGSDAREVPNKAMQLDVLLAALFPGGVPKLNPVDFTRLWETLVLAQDRNLALSAAGVDSDSELEQLLTVWGEVSGRAASAEELDRLIEVLERLVEAGAANLSPNQLQSLVDTVATRGAEPGEDQPGSRWPPIISLDGNKYRFKTGSAEITPEFEDYLTLEAANKIADLLSRYDADVIEIVGHTDEQVIEPREQKASNLDRVAIAAVNGETEQELIPVDNAGLGLARAIEVARVLRAQPDLSGVKIVPLSAGQLLRKGDLLSPGGEAVNDPERRRIEIRVRRSTPATD